MTADEENVDPNQCMGSEQEKHRGGVKVVTRKREPRKFVSKHFSQSKQSKGKPRKSRARKVKIEEPDDVASSPSGREVETEIKLEREPLPPTRIYFGVNVDELSSDSELTDVPSDIGPDPFSSGDSSSPTSTQRTKRKSKSKSKNPLISPYFPTESQRHRHRSHFLATLPFPPLSHTRFGLMQERLAHDPFRLLLATIFLNKTPGERAMPIFFDLMKRYPTPEALSEARVADVTEIIRTLGFQNQRARKCVEMAKGWVKCPPVNGKRYRKLNYPRKGDGRDVKEGEVVIDDDNVTDERVAWEISHLPGLGPYSHDSWRMFCRDEMKGLASDWLGEGTDADFEPEWKRVLPTDKELRAWMTWMWLKEGWIWNKETGKRNRADRELMEMAKEGGVVHEEREKNYLTVKGAEQETAMDKMAVAKPAGDFMPGSG